jgi:hypothetical protein
MNFLNLEANELTGTHFCAHSSQLVHEYTNLKIRPSCCAGNIPTEFGLCPALEHLRLQHNRLTGEHFFAQIDRLVYECTILQTSKFF